MALAAAAFLLVGPAVAQTPGGGGNAAAQPDQTWVGKIPRQSGVVALPGSGAKLDLGTSYDFIGPADAKRVITEVWGNPPDVADGVLGVILPKGGDPRDNGTWGAIVTFLDTGYVP